MWEEIQSDLKKLHEIINLFNTGAMALGNINFTRKRWDSLIERLKKNTHNIKEKIEKLINNEAAHKNQYDKIKNEAEDIQISIKKAFIEWREIKKEYDLSERYDMNILEAMDEWNKFVKFKNNKKTPTIDSNKEILKHLNNMKNNILHVFSIGIQDKENSFSSDWNQFIVILKNYTQEICLEIDDFIRKLKEEAPEISDKKNSAHLKRLIGKIEDKIILKWKDARRMFNLYQNYNLSLSTAMDDWENFIEAMYEERAYAPRIAVGPVPAPVLGPAPAPVLGPALASAPGPMPSLSSAPALAPATLPVPAPASGPAPGPMPVPGPAHAPAAPMSKPTLSIPAPTPAPTPNPAPAPIHKSIPNRNGSPLAYSYEQRVIGSKITGPDSESEYENVEKDEIEEARAFTGNKAAGASSK